MNRLRILKKIVVRTSLVLGFCLALLLVFLLNPILLYSHSTHFENLTVYHGTPLTPEFKSMVKKSVRDISKAELYQPDFHTDFCLNDGSYYPKLVKLVLGDDTFRAFANKLVVLSEPSSQPNRFVKWDQQINFSQWIRHGLIHNLQYRYHGFFDANPLGNHPTWKWEGYAEYESIGVSRSLEQIADTYNNASVGNFDLVHLSNDEKTLKLHLKYLLITKYCLEVLKMDYDSFMVLGRSEDEIYREVVGFLKK